MEDDFPGFRSAGMEDFRDNFSGFQSAGMEDSRDNFPGTLSRSSGSHPVGVPEWEV